MILPPGRFKRHDKTGRNRVAIEDADNGNRPRCTLGRERRHRAARRGDHGHPTADQIGREYRQSVILTFCPAIFDRHVLADDVTALAQTPTERGQEVLAPPGRSTVEPSDYRHRRLLRARRERPRGDHAAEKRDELAAFQLIELHSIACRPGARLQDIELAKISQEVTERFYNLLAVGEGGRCLKLV
jgi:hypothetical protein